MSAKIYLFRFTIALITFSLGFSLFNLGQHLFSTKLNPDIHLASLDTHKAEETNTFCRIDKINKPTLEISKSESEKAEKFDPTGDYYFIGKFPKEFKDLDSIGITTVEYKQTADGSFQKTFITPNGYFLTNKELKMSEIRINDQTILFKTEEMKGISYQFKGKFLNEKSYEIKNETVVLTGNLIKLQNSKKIAETRVKLGYAECGC